MCYSCGIFAGNLHDVTKSDTFNVIMTETVICSSGKLISEHKSIMKISIISDDDMENIIFDVIIDVTLMMNLIQSDNPPSDIDCGIIIGDGEMMMPAGMTIA